jgi:hypothetical protein
MMLLDDSINEADWLSDIFQSQISSARLGASVLSLLILPPASYYNPPLPPRFIAPLRHADPAALRA